MPRVDAAEVRVKLKSIPTDSPLVKHTVHCIGEPAFSPPSACSCYMHVTLYSLSLKIAILVLMLYCVYSSQVTSDDSTMSTPTETQPWVSLSFSVGRH